MLKVELLDCGHDRAGFGCGVEPLNRYLQQVARQHLSKGISKTFVLVEETAAVPKPVWGFFTLSICQVLARETPGRWANKLPDQIPTMRLGRLAVAKAHQGGGLGKTLLVEAIYKVASVADLAGGIGLFVDAKDNSTAGFYVKFGFEASPSAPLTLFMPMATCGSAAEIRRSEDRFRRSPRQSARRKILWDV